MPQPGRDAPQCSHPHTEFDEAGVRICAFCGEASEDQRSPLQIAQEMSTKGGLVGDLFRRIADGMTKKDD